MANLCLDSLLNRVTEQVGSKSYLKGIMKGWEGRIGIVAVDADKRYCLRFSPEGVNRTEWQEPIHLLLSGRERDLARMFGGEEMYYLGAKQSVTVKGPIRDQLKLDALLRLTCS
ncbi:SCP-2 sterol transfer family protein [Brevibacillus composti]|uniref:SCP-2 sterol transfer family protein n=1 Tax=Brevibacillus composti TaxID=2796470 RepID=A0A7T5EMB6_9BACL|nr:SCP-2 sterol transfer family protein [Brevibacillus composti]QQE75173.1 SCP-2 sterol transfer family protein [Brevibacillus composti]QUO42261.1 SCP-2 sterol transfer family protein [Brevibacillus composti]